MRMSVAFVILSAVSVFGALGAMLFRNSVHCALSLAVTFAGLAGLYLHLNAQFVGLVQILVYIGAVAVLIVFAILLTQSSEVTGNGSVFSSSWWIGAGVTAILAVTLLATISSTALPKLSEQNPPQPTVLSVGESLLSDYVLPLEVIGLLLTAALIGAVLIALDDRPQSKQPTAEHSPQKTEPQVELEAAR